jgi:hypothetical protein
MTTNWKIEQMERQLADGGVIVAHYRVFASEGDETVSAYGSQALVPDPESPDFVPFDQLSEDIVVDWVKGELTDLKVSQIEGQLAQVLDQKLHPTTAVGKPWDVAEPEPAAE